MKNIFLSKLVVLIILSSCNNTKEPITEIEKVSYSIGVSVAHSLKSQNIDSIDLNLLTQAFYDVLENEDPFISPDSSNVIINNYFEKLNTRKSEKALEEEKNYLSNNAEKEGVLTTESGLQYEIINSGNGKSPKNEDIVSVHYTGTLIDGTTFDSSIGKDPAKFQVSGGGLILGMTEALLLMKIGDKWKLTIPSNLAYGSRGVPQAGIAPNTTLIFEVELLSIE